MTSNAAKFQEVFGKPPDVEALAAGFFGTYSELVGRYGKCMNH